MTTTRLRKAIHYPSSDSDEGDHIDEEHQERLITTLQTEDARKTHLYRTLFLAIPLLSLLYATYHLLSPSTSARNKLLSLLSVSSLACTAYHLHFMPSAPPDRKGKKAVYKVEMERGPVERYLVLLNAVLAGVLGLAAWVSWRRGWVEDAWREALPGSEYCSLPLSTVVLMLGLTNDEQLFSG
ncbi:hypothetical protein BDY17DRAFT_27773 [Neohortaea acidophila]|uniref:Uncharacterized protein n=1 Tax=Neohortaea acidophila TaxID=245834 RepID=A0A6A6PIK6_9PEZI|nr:uncharacterized protein BDY17DRAFT_27773 [Neohortaea acidophila]KAF2479870.1 hypothetical protein BDY17DRAFT_27773 [Neohortaea acidophila]